jgi:hypothetical protein
LFNNLISIVIVLDPTSKKRNHFRKSLNVTIAAIKQKDEQEQTVD